jgi:hypothetical protein
MLCTSPAAHYGLLHPAGINSWSVDSRQGRPPSGHIIHCSCFSFTCSRARTHARAHTHILPLHIFSLFVRRSQKLFQSRNPTRIWQTPTEVNMQETCSDKLQFAGKQYLASQAPNVSSYSKRRTGLVRRLHSKGPTGLKPAKLTRSQKRNCYSLWAQKARN